jgi:hypothetical protein
VIVRQLHLHGLVRLWFAFPVGYCSVQKATRLEFLEQNADVSCFGDGILVFHCRFTAFGSVSNQCFNGGIGITSGSNMFQVGVELFCCDSAIGVDMMGEYLWRGSGGNSHHCVFELTDVCLERPF